MSKYDFSAAREVSEEEIMVQFRKFEDYILTFPPSRHTKLFDMYEALMPRLLTAPASAKVNYHNAFVGGYLLHVNHVIETAHLVERLYKHIGGVVDATHEEITFAAMHHDLGKLGDEDGPYYIKETDQYWIEKGSNFKYNDDTSKITTGDRRLYLLQKYGITYTKKEMIGMQMADGLFDPANNEYFKAGGVFPMKTSIGYIIHWADWMAARAENDVQRVMCEGQ